MLTIADEIAQQQKKLNPMSRCGIVYLIRQERTLKPVVKATDFKVEFGLNTSMTG
jgi:predicted transcriptional regulator